MKHFRCKNIAKGIIILFSVFFGFLKCENSIIIPTTENTNNVKYFTFTPYLGFPKNLNQSEVFSLKHPGDSLIKNFDLVYRYNVDPDYNFVEYNIEINLRPDKLSVYPKKDGLLGYYGALYPIHESDAFLINWEWNHKGLLKRYDENLDFDIDFKLEEYMASAEQYFALRIAKNDSLYYGWFRMEITRDSIIFKSYAYGTQHKQFILPGQVE